MAKYMVKQSYTTYVCVEVEADSKESAFMKGLDQVDAMTDDAFRKELQNNLSSSKTEVWMKA